MTFVEFIEYFRLWGPLGILAGSTSWGCVHLYRHGRADAKEHSVKLKAQADEAAAKLAAQADQHHGQVTDLVNRFVALHAEAATENRELTQQVRSLIEVVSKKRGR